MRTEYSDYEKELHKQKLEAWRIKYPFAAVMMSDISLERKIKFAEGMFPKHD